MFKFLVKISLVLLFLDSCNVSNNRSDGNIVTIKSSNWHSIKPKGMVAIPSGSFVIGKTDYDFVNNNDANPKTVSVGGFYMDETEITNSQYKYFVNYVRDSIARYNLAVKANNIISNDIDLNKNKRSISSYSFLNIDSKNKNSVYNEYIKFNNTGRDGGTDIELNNKLNWKIKLVWDKRKYPDIHYAEVIENMYKIGIDGVKRLDVKKLNYLYKIFDINTAALKKEDKNIENKYIKTISINIYPDTTVWVRDFSNSYNDPMHQNYFSHKAYSNYPVVGVNWDQANAFCDFRTKYYNSHIKNKKNRNLSRFRLPTEIEWEYAARGGLKNSPYPWGGPYLTDKKGCYLANFKPKRGDYLEMINGKKIGYMYTSPVKTFQANGYGLYDMAGNVSEWTASSYDRMAYNFMSSMNPSLNLKTSNKKTIRGGSWKDIGYLLMVSSRDWEYKDSARSYIGFRTVKSFPEGVNVKIR